MRPGWLPLLVALSLANACRDRAETDRATHATALPVVEDASAPEADQRAEDASASAPEPAEQAEPATRPHRRAGQACDADANDPRCDYETEACIRGRCVTCAKGLLPMVTRCAHQCATDRDCPRGLICNFIASGLSLCDPPAPKRKCAPGEIWLRSDGDCWKLCKSDSDCPQDKCCQSDPNARAQICMGRCP